MVSDIPVVRNRVRRISWSVGRKSLANSRSMSWKKLLAVSRSATESLVYLLAQIVMQGILVALQYCQLHALVCPQAIEGCEEFFGHWLLGAYIRRRVDHLGVSLWRRLACVDQAASTQPHTMLSSSSKSVSSSCIAW